MPYVSDEIKEYYIMKENKYDKIFVEVITNNKEGLYREAYSFLLNKEDAEDAVSSAILKAYSNLSKLQNIGKMRAWLFRILINECKDMWKKQRGIKYSDVPIAELESVETSETGDLYEMVCELESQFKETALLYYFENFKIKEIAEILNIPEGTVKSRLARARIQLKELIKRKGIR